MHAKLYGPTLCIAAAVGLAMSQLANGQAAQTAQTTPSTPASAQDLSEIIVTARRVEERAQDVPISMTIFNQRALTDRQIVTSGDLALATPSMSVDSEFGQDVTSFAIRGFVQTLQATPSVAVYFADAVVPRGGNVGEPAGSGVAPGSFFDLQNVQVLKGPQGTLFGRNTDGGAVLLVPNKPTSEFGGYVGGGFGNFNMRQVEGVLNVPLGENVRFRLGANAETRDGFENNYSGIGPSKFENIDFTAARASLVVDITPNLENYTVGTYNLSVNNGLLPQLFQCNFSQGPASAGATLCPATLATLQGKGDYAVANNYPPAESYLKQWQAINTTTWHASDSLTAKNIFNYGTLVTALDSGLFGAYLLQVPGVPGYIPFLTSTSGPSVIGAKSTDQYTWSDELQFSGNTLGNKLVWQGGGYIERSGPLGDPTGTRSGNFLICPDVGAFLCSGPGVVGESFSRVHWFDGGIFAQGTYAITNQWKVTGGVRYTWDKNTADVNQTTYAGFPPQIPGTYAFVFCNSAFTTPAQNCGTSYSQSSKAPTGTFDIDYNPTQDVLIYAKYARGYRQGGVATFVADGYHTYGPEHVDSYELGEKTTFTGPVRGTFNVTGFYNNFTDQQLLAGFVGPQVAPSSGIVNAGKSRIYGAEVESTLLPISSLALTLSYTYLNTELQSAFTALPPGGFYTQVLFPAVVGGPLPFAPKNKLSASATYTLPVPDSVGTISIGANYTYQTEMLVSATASPYDTLKPYGLLGANLHWDGILRSPVDIEAFATNLTNKLYYNNLTQLYDSPFGIAGGYLGEPRMYGVRLRVRFGKDASR